MEGTHGSVDSDGLKDGLVEGSVEGAAEVEGCELVGGSADSDGWDVGQSDTDGFPDGCD